METRTLHFTFSMTMICNPQKKQLTYILSRTADLFLFYVINITNVIVSRNVALDSQKKNYINEIRYLSRELVIQRRKDFEIHII